MSIEILTHQNVKHFRYYLSFIFCIKPIINPTNSYFIGVRLFIKSNMYKQKISLNHDSSETLFFGKTILFKDNKHQLSDYITNYSLKKYHSKIKGRCSTYRLKDSTAWEVNAILNSEIILECPSELVATHYYLIILRSTQLLHVKLSDNQIFLRVTTEVKANEMVVYIDSKVNIQIQIPANTQIKIQLWAISKEDLLTRIDTFNKLKLIHMINLNTPFRYVSIDKVPIINSIFNQRIEPTNYINQIVKMIGSIIEKI